MANNYDIVIVGGGPAGLTAAIYARRADKSVLVLEKSGFGGQIAWSPRVANYPGFASISGAELSDRMLSQALELGAEADLSEVTGLEPHDGGFIVHTSDGDYGAGAVVLATGARHRKLGVAREDELAGSGVCYCATCDGAFYAGRDVAVAGGGDAALQDALLLSNSCNLVYIIHRRETFRAEAANVDALAARGNIRRVMNARVVGLLGEGELSGVAVEDAASGGAARDSGGRPVRGRRPRERQRPPSPLWRSWTARAGSPSGRTAAPRRRGFSSRGTAAPRPSGS